MTNENWVKMSVEKMNVDVDMMAIRSPLGMFKAGRISHLTSRISHLIGLYNIDLRVRCDLFVMDALNASSSVQHNSHMLI